MPLSDFELLDSFSARGHWWLPNNPGDRVPGTLKFSNRQIQLELDGLFSVPEFELPGLLGTSGSIFKAPAILGETREGDFCTIFRVIATHVSQNHLQLRGNTLIIGGHFQDEAGPRFRKVIVGYSHLEEWAYQKLIQQSTGVNKDCYNFVLPTEAKTLLRVAQVPPLKDLILVANLQVSFERTQTSMTNRNYFLLEFTQGLGLQQVNNVIGDLGGLLTLLVGEAVQPVKIRLTLDDESFRANPHVAYFLSVKTPAPKAKSEFEMPLPLAVLGESVAETLFKNWFLKNQELGPVSDLLLSTIYEPNQYVQSTFLSLTQGLESFHRHLYDGLYVPKEEYRETNKTLVEAIPSVTSPKLAEKIKAMLNWGNEYTLRDRLEQLLEGLDQESRDQLTNWIAPKEFIRTVASVRNYLTHYKESSKPEIIDNLLDMYNLNQRLRAIQTVLFLKHLGMDEKSMANKIALHLHLGF